MVMFSEQFGMNFIITNGGKREGSRKYGKNLKFSHFLQIEGEKLKYPNFFLKFPLIWLCGEFPALELNLLFNAKYSYKPSKVRESNSGLSH